MTALTLTERRAQLLIRELRRHLGGTAHWRNLADAIFADDPDGGPLSAPKIIYDIVQLANHALAGSGWIILGKRGPRGGYRLTYDETRATGRWPCNPEGIKDAE